jgi:aryl-alcohol dehydrogenase-like predicted oxidoreductase
VRVIHAALDAGMTLVDTADSYCLDERDKHHGEQLVVRALASRRGDRSPVVVATKGGLLRPGGDWIVEGRPKRLRQSCERSLQALASDCIDLYQLHAPDPEVPWADSVGELARLRAEGKILRLGICNVEIRHLEEALDIVPIAAVQNRLNCFDRQPLDSGLVSACEKRDVAFLAHSPVGGHHGRVRTPEDATLRRVGERLGASAYEVALAWLLAISKVIIPIPGASRVASAVSSARAADLVLSGEDRAELREAFGW